MNVLFYSIGSAAGALRKITHTKPAVVYQISVAFLHTAPEITLRCIHDPVGLVLHPARNRTRSWAGFPHGYVIVLDGRQPACVLCLALRKSRSKPKSAF